jgi:hypothetical protein
MRVPTSMRAVRSENRPFSDPCLVDLICSCSSCCFGPAAGATADCDADYRARPTAPVRASRRSASHRWFTRTRSSSPAHLGGCRVVFSSRTHASTRLRLRRCVKGGREAMRNSSYVLISHDRSCVVPTQVGDRTDFDAMQELAVRSGLELFRHVPPTPSIACCASSGEGCWTSSRAKLARSGRMSLGTSCGSGVARDG